jgi:hypothetical protein
MPNLMHIPPVKPENISQVPKARFNRLKSEPSRTEEAAQDSVQTEPSDQLLNTLRNEPDMRPDMVEHGKVLAADTNYPPAETVADLAKLFVQPAKK